ncbi:MAG: M23 family metallopeptidase [Treponema sp.]|jgi:murein DD-endopeptidase MepM/ murein hydrolase activator NlpD|nr:M23 family metallopeptidase [Treponema sp.]
MGIKGGPVAPVHGYKRFENKLVLRIKESLCSLFKRFSVWGRAAGRFLTQPYTLVLVPHSPRRVYNFPVTPLFCGCVLLVLAGMAGAFIWYGFSYNNARRSLAAMDSRLQDAEAGLDQMRDAITHLLRQTRSFQSVFANTLSALGLKSAAASPAAGDLAAFFAAQESAGGRLREVTDIRNLAEYLASAQEPVKEIGSLFASQRALLTEIPNISPVQGGIGHVTTYFGQNINPFTGQYYLHRGIDISTYRQGDPVVATADGQAVTLDYDHNGLGNYIIIKHKHGFYTRYAHLLSFTVTRGQRVRQGEIIGRIGNTGLSTGPHVHYEVHLGADAVDPYKYLNNLSLRSGSDGTNW